MESTLHTLLLWVGARFLEVVLASPQHPILLYQPQTCPLTQGSPCQPHSSLGMGITLGRGTRGAARPFHAELQGTRSGGLHPTTTVFVLQ